MAGVVRTLTRWLVYAAAALVVLLAIAVGLFRLLVPELPEYREDIEQRISDAVGLDVRVATLDARWRLLGPELIAGDVVVQDPETAEELIRAERVVIGTSVIRLAIERRVVINRFELDGAVVDISRDETGSFRLGTTPLERILAARGEPAADAEPPALIIHIDNLRVRYTDPAARRVETVIAVPSFDWIARRDAVSLTAQLELPDDGGAPLDVSLNHESANADWNLYLKADETDFGAYLRTLPANWPVPDTGYGAVEFWLNVGAAGGLSASANLDLAGVAVPLPGDAPAIVVGVRGHAEWQDSDEAMLVGFDIDALSVSDSDWPATRGELRLGRSERGDLSLKLTYLSFDDLMAFADWLPADVREQIVSASPSGDLTDTEIDLSGWEVDDLHYKIDTRFSDLSWEPVFTAPGVSGLSGQLSMDGASGRLSLDMDAFSLRYPGLFPEPLEFRRADGNVSWHRSGAGLTIVSDTFHLVADAFEMVSDIEVQIPENPAELTVTLSNRFGVGDLNAVTAYLPRGVMHPRLSRWFDEGLIAGRLENGELKLRGRLTDFPFRDNDGEFTVRADVVDTTLKFARDWPAAEVESAVVTMDGLALRSVENRGSILGNPANNTRVEIADLLAGELVLEAEASTTLPAGLTLVRGSPIRKVFGDTAGRLSGSGRIDYRVALRYPIKTKVDWSVDARISTTDAELILDPLAQSLSGISGAVTISRSAARETTLGSDSLTGVILGSPVSLELLSGDKAQGLAALAIVDGALTAAGMREEIATPALAALSGETRYRATVRFPLREAEDSDFSIRVDSDLAGLAIAAPYPLGKPAATERTLQANIVFPEAGRLDLEGQLDAAGTWALSCLTDESVEISGGQIVVGSALANQPDGEGLWIGGAIDSLRVNDWLDFVATLELPPSDTPVLRGIRLEADELFAYGQRIENAAVQADRNPSEWMVQVSSPSADGAIFVPTDLDAGDPIVLRMARLHLVEADPEAKPAGDPRDLPALLIDAEDFMLADQRFGSLLAELTPVAAGIEASRLETAAPSFRATGTGRWIVATDDAANALAAAQTTTGTAESETGPETATTSTVATATTLTLDVTSTDTAATAEWLALDVGVMAESAAASIDVSWQGEPRAEFFDSLDGEFSIRVADGRLDEVDPGAARVLGLMSVVEIPRRLSLDFRDVFAKGLTFSEITADYRLVNGEAFTCNLSLQAPAADIALIGRASLTRRDYNQTVVVNANVGNTLPAVGAVVGGPQVAAAMLVISRIFKKPLQGLGQAYYQINGSWDDPSIERTTVERFYATSQLADCLQASP